MTIKTTKTKPIPLQTAEEFKRYLTPPLTLNCINLVKRSDANLNLRFFETEVCKATVSDDMALAHWFIPAIALPQTKKLLSNIVLRDFEIWKLLVSAEHTATLICEWDTNKKVLEQQIEFTNLPLPTIKLYLARKVLAGEY